MKCRTDFINCPDYDPDAPEESRCKRDIGWGYCTEEQEANEKDKDS